MIEQALGMFLTPERLRKASESLAADLKKHELQPNELPPIMVIKPLNGKIFIDTIVLKDDAGVVKYSRKIDSIELNAEGLKNLKKAFSN